eukprot:TRINITY_DN4091_c0_g1_i2.p1 TRINITY_DN4091_c0_g1~~TRINITY_DN4091_c0_g1_i2.p1  ORF type:complete len:652 (+),score=165.45 TRINITY_DN4091_c0_g1_i2:55-2010(+)
MLSPPIDDPRQHTRVVKTLPLPDNNRLTEESLNWDIKEDNGGDADFNIERLRDHFLAEGRLMLDTAINIVKRATQIFKSEKNMVELSAPITIFGDVHGQYFDMINVLKSLPLPRDDDPWLFLGDYVDRGLFGMEVILYLFSLKIKWPKAVYLLRGNHECRQLAKAYQFRKECLGKYKSINLFDAIMECFDCLPIATLLDGGSGCKFLCLHGGLSPDVKKLEEIQSMNRFQEPPQKGALCDILWSDPLEDDTANGLRQEDMHEWYAVNYEENSNRGAGYIFGFTAISSFLADNDLCSLIRAHDVQRLGYCEHWMHSKTNRRYPPVITVFSAPNYCGYMDNQAAYLRVEPAKKSRPADKFPTPNTPTPESELIQEKPNASKTSDEDGAPSSSSSPPASSSSDHISDNSKTSTKSLSSSSVTGSETEECISNKNSSETTESEEDDHNHNQSSKMEYHHHEEMSFSSTDNNEQYTYEEDVDYFDEYNNNEYDDWNQEQEVIILVDPYAECFPKLIYSQYEWVESVPYWLPSFENGIQHTIGLVIDKVKAVVNGIMKIDAGPDSDSEDNVEPPTQKPSIITTPPPTTKKPTTTAAVTQLDSTTKSTGGNEIRLRLVNNFHELLNTPIDRTLLYSAASTRYNMISLCIFVVIDCEHL